MTRKIHREFISSDFPHLRKKWLEESKSYVRRYWKQRHRDAMVDYHLQRARFLRDNLTVKELRGIERAKQRAALQQKINRIKRLLML